MTVNRIKIRGTGIETSAIGFGCASLGSRVSRAAGLRALEDAFERGVTWFDVAPAYGSGQAETILGEFAARRRDRIGICTKVGMVAPRRNAIVTLAKRMLSERGGLAAPLRKKYRSMRTTRNRAVEITGETILNSIDRSLTSLGVGHVDLFALHAPAASSVGAGDVIDALQEVLTKGKARQVGVSGDVDAARAALAHPDLYSVVQIADSPWASPLAALRIAAVREMGFVTHSVFGIGGSLEDLTERLVDNAADRERLEALGYSGTVAQVAAAALLDRALAANAEGVVVTSMFSPAHRSANIERASQPIRPEVVAALEAIVQTPTKAA